MSDQDPKQPIPPIDEQMDAVQSLPSGKAEEFMTREEQQKLFAEWRADYHAARVSDYGEVDAATYEQRLRDGAKMMTPSITAAILADPQRLSTPGAVAQPEKPNYQPTGRNRHIERVTSRIEELKSASYWCTDEGVSPHTHDEERGGYYRGVTSDGSGWDNWNNLTTIEKENVLRYRVDWEGFGRSHIKNVIDKVIRDEPVERWMNCVRYPASLTATHAADTPPQPGSITAAILDNPKSFLAPEQQQDGNEHDSSPDRGR